MASSQHNIHTMTHAGLAERQVVRGSWRRDDPASTASWPATSSPVLDQVTPAAAIPNRALREICCYCPGWNPRDPANKGASHSICPTCLRRVHAELDALEASA
jgi:hypothetical protein